MDDSATTDGRAWKQAAAECDRGNDDKPLHLPGRNISTPTTTTTTCESLRHRDVSSELHSSEWIGPGRTFRLSRSFILVWPAAGRFQITMRFGTLVGSSKALNSHLLNIIYTCRGGRNIESSSRHPPTREISIACLHTLPTDLGDTPPILLHELL